MRWLAASGLLALVCLSACSSASDPVTDPPPRLLGIHQWGKGAQPATGPTFAAGDPIGRMVGVLFSEEVEEASAAASTAYEVLDNRIVDVSLQPDRRLAFVIVEKPVGPFVPREMTVAGVRDRAARLMAAESHGRYFHQHIRNKSYRYQRMN